MISIDAEVCDIDGKLLAPVVTKRKRRKGDVPCKTCPQCYTILAVASRVCYECGYEFPRKVKAND